MAQLLQQSCCATLSRYTLSHYVFQVLNQKNPRVRKIHVRNSGAGNGCTNFMDAWKKCGLSAGKPMSIKFRVLGGFWGGGKCRFYFYGRADFSDWRGVAGESRYIPWKALWHLLFGCRTSSCLLEGVRSPEGCCSYTVACRAAEGHLDSMIWDTGNGKPAANLGSMLPCTLYPLFWNRRLQSFSDQFMRVEGFGTVPGPVSHDLKT